MTLHKWHQLGLADPTTLRDARLLAHWAVQPLAAVGNTLLPHDLEHTETALTWLHGASLIAGPVLSGVRPVRAALRLHDLSLMVVDEGGRGVLAGALLEGRTLAWALDWLRHQLTVARGEATIHLRRPEHSLPTHPVGEGGPFHVSGELERLVELERWFANAFALIGDWVEGRADASQVRLWPQRLEVRSSTKLPIRPGQTEDRTVVIGMSPGDEHLEQPHFHVSPQPVPSEALLADRPGDELSPGRWLVGDRVAGVLRGTDLVGMAADLQRASVADFLARAEPAVRGLLGER